MSKKRFTMVMLGVLSVLGASAFLQEKLAPGVAAPDFELENLEGKSVKLSELKGKPVFLDFWATWCGPCRRALPHTQEFAKKYKGKAHIYAVNVRESKEKVQQFMEQNGYTFPRVARYRGRGRKCLSSVGHSPVRDYRRRGQNPAYQGRLRTGRREGVGARATTRHRAGRPETANFHPIDGSGCLHSAPCHSGAGHT
jgi:thiol-disulfide isomerase/thioredoxin